MAEIKTDSYSPMMQKYLTTKENYKDCILMYRLGDFYEMFFDDALEASKILDITLTGRNCGLEERAPMCGVPFHAVDAYVAKLIAAGKKVAICEQLEAASKDSKEILDRGVIRVITAGTAIESDILAENTNNYLASICMGENDIGIAVCDLSTGEFLTTQISVDNLNKIEEFLVAYKPSEIICNSLAMPLNESLRVFKGRALPKMALYFDWAYALNKATDSICRQYKILNLKSFGLSNLPLSVGACGALVQYLAETQKRSLPQLRNIRIMESGQYMSIDINSRRNLELTNNTRDNSRYGSLLWLVDNTQTSMGARKLNAWISRPLQSPKDIKLRLDAVEELTKDFVLRETLYESLNGIKDLERLSTKVAFNTAGPRDLQALCSSINKLPFLSKCLLKSKSQLLQTTMSHIVLFEELSKLLNCGITDKECPATIRDGGFVKDGFNQQLDEYRHIISHTAEYLEGLRSTEAEKTGIKSLKLGNNRVFGYYFEVTNQYKDLVPKDYIRKQSLANGERFVTEELKIAEEKIITAGFNAVALEQKLFAQLCAKVVDEIPQIQRTANAIAIVDCLVGFSKTAVKNNYIKPQINTVDSTLKIVDGRHPIVEKFLKGESFVPNSVVLNNTDNRTMILTGPNMAGKSTFMRQVALIVLMTHIGCFVPAKSALVPITDKIFTRVGASDEIAFNQSTFMVEMAEVAYILNNATQNSLIVLDEIGRGTATFDGLSIAWAVMEYICKQLKSKTLFATHYHELSELEGRLEGVVNFKITVKETNGTIVFLRKIMPGGAHRSFGIEVAQLAGVPKEVSARARVILKQLEKSDVNKMVFANEDSDDEIAHQQQENKTAGEIFNQLKNIDINNCTPLVAFDVLSELVARAKKN